MQYIRSRENTQVKHIRKLGRSKAYRHEHQECIVEGLRALTSFINSRHTVLQVYIQEDRITPDDIPIDQKYITIVTAAVMDKMSTAHTPSGIIGHIQLHDWQATAAKPGLGLVEISDPGNIGTLIRSSVALNYRTITVIDCADPWNPKSIQASAGTIAHAYLHITEWDDLYNSTHLTTCALTAYNATPIETISVSEPLILVGNEAHGLPDKVSQEAHQRIALRMPGPAESYNAAIAGSIALYTITGKDV